MGWNINPLDKMRRGRSRLSSAFLGKVVRVHVVVHEIAVHPGQSFGAIIQGDDLQLKVSLRHVVIISVLLTSNVLFLV